MVTTTPRPTPGISPDKQSRLPAPKGDYRLLTPGWGGELAPDEFEYILIELMVDKKLSFSWGFQPGKKRRPEWSIRQVAEWGDPNRRATNMQLARHRTPETLVVGI